MNQIANLKRGSLTEFRPESSKEVQSVLKAAIQHAKNMEEWEAGWDAIDRLIEEQISFISWWTANVRKPGNQPIISDRKYLAAEEAEDATGITSVQVSRWKKSIADKSKYRESLYGAAHKRAMADPHNHRAQGTGENEWYTPPKYIELARAVLAEIDLDPASSEIAQETVRAKSCFTKNSTP